jgi:rhodanese-related sulfurtransferase
MFKTLYYKLRPDHSQKIPAQEAYQAVKEGGASLLDVRELGELATGLAENAEWVATSEIDRNSPRWQEFLAHHPKEKPIIIYCAVGGRAGRIAEVLTQQGYQAYNMGGFKEWVAAGLPTRANSTSGV